MIRIAIFTTTRADFGIYIPFINRIINTKGIDYKLFVGGSHLAQEHGKTIKEIESAGYKITRVFDYLLNNDTAFSLTKSASIATYEMAEIFEKEKFDFTCLLGDRFELLSIAQVSIIYKKPIIHIHGGEISQGAIDEQIRHMLTKAAHIHFVSCQEYYDNILRMGEQKWRIFNTGALAVENIKKYSNIKKEILYNELNLDITKNTAILTYHPTTLENKISTENQIKNIFAAIKNYNIQLVITAPNMDVDREIIIKMVETYINSNNNYKFYESLGTKRYLSLLNYCKFVIGNSSSGILEVPFFKIPTINIGFRQKGRLQHLSIIDTDYSVESIKKGIEKALSENFLASLSNMKYKFGSGDASKKMIDAIFNVSKRDDLMTKIFNVE